MFEANANGTCRTKLNDEYDPWAYDILNVNTNGQVSQLFIHLKEEKKSSQSLT